MAFAPFLPKVAPRHGESPAALRSSLPPLLTHSENKEKSALLSASRMAFLTIMRTWPGTSWASGVLVLLLFPVDARP